MLEDILHHKPLWLIARPGEEGSIAVSSRIRLARNLADMPFPHRCTDEQRREVIDRITAAVEVTTLMQNACVYRLEELSSVDRHLLVERHLVSPEFINQDKPAALIVSRDETCAVMINEEDHIRMQVLSPGMQLKEAWTMIDTLDSEIEDTLTYAYSTRYGYLTVCPTNVGTGMRASVMLHLPALVHEQKISSVISAVGKIGIAVRGMYGEHSAARGNFFQLSNQVTLGRSEQEIVHQLHQIVTSIIAHERRLREGFLTTTPHKVRNAVGRAYGTLKYAEILKSDEATDLLSTLLMGIDLNAFSDVDRGTVSELLLDIQPAHLQKMCGKQLTPEERDVERAAIIRARLQQGPEEIHEK
jgi:protein arginine kinase